MFITMAVAIPTSISSHLNGVHVAIELKNAAPTGTMVSMTMNQNAECADSSR